jgi:hypothetical protein
MLWKFNTYNERAAVFDTVDVVHVTIWRFQNAIK